ncbi:MAG: redoxin domain-containing protein [Flavobacteriales bacterium]|nr:redoxin domain-containing protein [Flavobacteriales bacterium]NQX98517.1 redoxin domain-containing protein [Flavobacteriales bacterium]
MKNLKAKDEVIQFSLKDYLGNAVNLSDYKGKKVFLTFLRGASCPFCSMRMRDLINKHSNFKANGIEVIVFYASSKELITKYAGKQDPPFSVIPDPNLEMYTKYGVEQSKSGMTRAMMQPLKMMKVMFSGFFNMKASKDRPIIPADFLIDENQTIFKVYYGEDFGDHLPVDEILNWK